MLLPRLAWRNLLRNRRRTLLTMTAMGVATGVLVVILGLQEGVLFRMVEVTTELERGHVVVADPDYLDDRRLQAVLPASGPDSAPQRLADREDLRAVAGRLRGYALLSHGEDEAMEAHPAELLGLRPDEERRVTALLDYVREGRVFAGAATGSHVEVVIGAGLARRLLAGVGSELAVMGQAADGSIIQALFRVTGLLDTGDPLRDNMLVLLDREQLGRLLGLPDAVHEWGIALRDPLLARDWAALHAEAVPGAGLLPWHGMIPQIAEILDMMGVAQIISAIFFYFAVVLIALNTMSMSFFERIREFAVMGALGLRPRRMWRLILIEGLTMSVLAALGGALAGFLLSLWLEAHPVHLDLPGFTMAGMTTEPVITTRPTPRNVLLPALMLVLLGMLASLPPALRLRALRPVDALREV